MEIMGEEDLTPENFRNEVMLANPTLNDMTIFSAMMNPSKGLIDIVPVDSDYPDVSRR
jgi:hypothetical protein